MLDSCVSLFLEIVFISHKIVGVAALLLQTFCNFATRMSICSFSDGFLSLLRGKVRLVGLEPTTPRLSSACSNQLSYSRVDVEGKDRDSCRRLRLRGVDLRALLSYSIERR